jgi:serine protease
MTWQRGVVEHNPKVYVVFWGPTWKTDTGEEAAANYLLSFYQGLGTSSDTWSTITSQYADASGSPVFSGSVFGASMVDTSTPPASVTDANLADEAASAALSFGIPDTSDDQVVVASQSGTCFSDGFVGSCGTPATQGYCAWHSNTSFDNSNGEISFTNLPYQLDAGFSCGEDWINSGGTYDGFSTVGGHEYAEAVTDPFPSSGWIDNSDNVSGGEIGDKCAWAGSGWNGSDPAGDVTLSTGTFAMQSLWDNASSRCLMSSAGAPPPPPATSLATGQLSGGGHSGTSITVHPGTAVKDAATLSGTNAATATGLVSYFVYSDKACSNLVADALDEPIGTPGTLPASTPITLGPVGTYYWAVSYSGDSNNASSASKCGGATPVGVETVTPVPVVKPAINTTASAAAKSSVSVAVSTTVANDLLVAYVTGKGPAGKAQLATVTASGLKWTLVGRSDAGRGDAEVWAARAAGKLSKLKVTATAKYAGWPVAVTVVAYQSASGVGAHAVKHATSGAPAGSLTTTAANSWVFAVGDDWAKAAARTVGTAQHLVHQSTDTAGDTYWVQATNAVTAKSGTKVTINDTKPTADPYNLVLVEIR